MMDKKTLQTEILEAPYNHDKWMEVLKLYFGVNKILAQPKKITYSNTNWTDNVESAYELGSFNTADERLIGIYEVNVSDNVWIEKNRVGLRNLLKQVHQDVDGALIVFIQNEKWRFSYVSEIRTEEGKKHTEPKRYTYLFGKGETCRTASDRFDKLKGSKFYLNDLYDAFSVDKLTKDFFKSYKEYFEKFSDYLAQNPQYRKIILHSDYELDKGWKSPDAKPIRDFVKKLLGRLVFLQFLQKKGWMGVSANVRDWINGDMKFIQNLFNNSNEKERFHSKTLKSLFFETLNKKRNNDTAPIELGLNIKIPYLNGGLFDNDVSFSNAIDFPASLFQGLLDFFEQYNFTIDENDPYDSEVGIDPEMLGHIFENLLEENREKGAFYTPKEIVHYMCHESLIEYLKTHLPDINKEEIEDFVRINKVSNIMTEYRTATQINKLLKDVKICDPAIGSGAFPMGLLKEIFDCRKLLYPYLKNSDNFNRAEIKKEIIQNNIYGVDIDNGAVEIARLRFWLALVVDENNPQPLPNLDYKIMQGNSLLESYKGVELNALTDDTDITENPFHFDKGEMFVKSNVNASIFEKEDKNELYSLINEYFDFEDSQISTWKNKQEIKERINAIVEGKLITKFYLDKLKVENEINEIKNKINLNQIKSGETTRIRTDKLRAELKLNQQLVSKQKELEELNNSLEELKDLEESHEPKPYFLWHLWFKDVFEQGGFDIVIGNPPYIQIQKFSGQEIQKAWQSQNFETFNLTGDIYALFIEKGINILKESGNLTFITSNKWMRAGYGELLRNFLATKTAPLQLIDFGGYKVFESATVDTNIIITKKTQTRASMLPVEHTFSSVQNVFHACTISSDFNIDIPIHNYFDEYKQLMPKMNKSAWVISSNIELQIKNKIEVIGTPLKDWDIKIYRGVLTGFNEAFIIDGKTKDKLIAENPKSAEIIKPILKGRDIKRYKAKFADLWLINSHNGIKEKVIPRIDVPKDYPAIYKYLKQFENQLINRQDKGDHWTNLRNCAYLQEFEKEKIVYPETTQNNNFIIDNGYFYIEKTSFILIGINLKYLLSIFNSQFFKNIYKILFSSIELGKTGYQYNKFAFEKFPVPKISEEAQQPFIDLVDKILAKKENNEETTAEEREIDLMVYKLYKLTYDEVKVIEPEFAMSREEYEKFEVEG